MPNWCENELTVNGSTDDLDRFIQFAKKGDELIEVNNFIPYPVHFREADKAHEQARKDYEEKKITWEEYIKKPKDGYNSGGYEWCIKNWGTKWGFVRTKMERPDPQELLFVFDTAWSPPIPVIRKMGEMFPSLSFRLDYWEGGCGFQGGFEMLNGESTEDWTEDYNGERGG